MDEKLSITEAEKLMLSKEIIDYWASLEIYNDVQKRALFLMGFLIGKIGNEQSTSESHKKPILNKLNFQGMDYQKILRLTNDVFEKLNQYRILRYNENIYSCAKQLFEKEKDWKLSNQENVFYVLSGYAFSNFMSYLKTKEHYNSELTKATKMIEELKEKGEDTSELEKRLTEAIEKSKQSFSQARVIINNIIKETE